MKDFCRIFNHPTRGQMVALLGTNEDGNPCLSLSVRPPELGVCSIQLARDNDEPEDYELMQEALDSLTLDMVTGFTLGLFNFLSPPTVDNEEQR
jgi:hypothetical protein